MDETGHELELEDMVRYEKHLLQQCQEGCDMPSTV